MPTPRPVHTARCRCGAVQLGAWAAPIAVAACYCDDCQAAAAKIAQTGAVSPADPDGGTAFMLFRRDRLACTGGSERLCAVRLREGTKTRRMVAECCGTAMYLAFDDSRPWVSAFRDPFGETAPPVQMRICTRFRRTDAAPADDGLPSHAGYPPSMMLKILAAAPGLLFAKPVEPLP